MEDKTQTVPDFCIVKNNSPWHKFTFGNIDRVDLNKYCSGCSACKYACKKGAIVIKESEEGFYTPSVIEEKCTRCKKCVRACPILNFKFQIYNNDSKYYAAQASKNLCASSSSGGVFSLLANYILKNGGVVFGAKWSKDKTKVIHGYITKFEEIPFLQGSKYVQSDISTTFPIIKDFLKQRKHVLFTGTSCQVDGLKKYLGSEYDDLIIYVDFVCNGVPSNKVLQKYLRDVIIKSPKEIVQDIKFRIKDQGWYSRSIKIKTSRTEYCIPNFKSLYMQAFFKGLSTNRICTVCPYATLRKISDITLGDFWEIKSFDAALDDNSGTSFVSVNSIKGKKVLNDISKELRTLKEVPVEWMTRLNTNLIRPIRHHNREQFFYNLDKKNFQNNYSECIRDFSDCIIYNDCITDINYGAILTAYALQEVITNLGYFVKLLNTQRVKFPNYLGSFGHLFARDYLHLTEITQDEEKFFSLNGKTKYFIVGSDQVWRTKYWNKDLDRVLLSFVESHNIRASVAASFGLDVFEGNERHHGLFERELPKFNKISVRELSGVEICKKEFGVDAEWILDPVFILDRACYVHLASKSKINFSGKIVYYGWEFDKTKHLLLEICEYLSNRYSKKFEVIDITSAGLSVEEWLSAIRSCDLVVTNSYHGLCFSIIFKKKFLCFNDIGEGRFNTLCQILPLSDHVYQDICDVNISKFLESKLDYNAIYNILQPNIIKSLNFIKSIFE